MSSLPDLLNTSILELQKGLTSGLFTSCDLVKAYTARIKEVNDVTHAVIQVNPDALSIAEKMDTARKASRDAAKSPLYGIPMLIKDNIATKEMDCTAGSLALVGAKTAHDSTAARKLKEAGAIILGRANMSEWAYFRSWDNSSGFSGVGGQVICAYHPQGDPSGSSSGSGSAMAVGLAAATLGSETDGSIISPSTRNNLAGMKPTIGLVSRHGVIPISTSQDSAGPMCATVKDVAIVLDAISGSDPNDEATMKAPQQKPSYLASLDPGLIKGARIGISHQFSSSLEEFMKEDPTKKMKYSEKIPPSDYINRVFDDAVQTIKSLGAETIEVSMEGFPDDLTKQLKDDEFQVLLTEFKVGVEAYMQTLDNVPSGCQTLADLIQFNIDHKELEMPERNAGQDLFEKAQETSGLEDPKYLEARARSLKYSTELGLDKLFSDHKLDVVITFSDSDTSPPKLVSWLSAMSGYPICCVPLGFLPKDQEPSKIVPIRRGPNFPFGLVMVGLPWTEAKMLSYAAAFEHATQVRKKGVPFKGACPTTNLKDVVSKKM